MDRFAANTLCTLGIVLISIFVVGASLVLLLLALCLGALGNSGTNNDPQAGEWIFLLLLITAILIAGGIFSIAKLSKGIVLNTPEFATPLQSATLLAGEAVSTGAPSPPIPSVTQAPEPEPRPAYDVAAHFSPASLRAIQQLALAIVAKVTAELLITVAGWMIAHPAKPAPPLMFRYSFLAWGAAAIAPHVVLLYALLRHPGPRAFAYSLVIPALHIFFGFFGHSTTLFFLFSTKTGIPALSLLTIIPWLLDILILYLAWKAIRQTGIQPSPTRLIVAAAVIFIYTSILPLLVVTQTPLLRPR